MQNLFRIEKNIWVTSSSVVGNNPTSKKKRLEVGKSWKNSAVKKNAYVEAFRKGRKMIQQLMGTSVWLSVFMS